MILAICMHVDLGNRPILKRSREEKIWKNVRIMIVCSLARPTWTDISIARHTFIFLLMGKVRRRAANGDVLIMGRVSFGEFSRYVGRFGEIL